MSKAQVGFFLFHVIMQIPAGMCAEQYGAKIVMQVSMLYCASISLFTPFAIIIGGPVYMIVLVSLQGLGQVIKKNGVQQLQKCAYIQF